jgi:hypothetical protein
MRCKLDVFVLLWHRGDHLLSASISEKMSSFFGMLLPVLAWMFVEKPASQSHFLVGDGVRLAHTHKSCCDPSNQSLIKALTHVVGSDCSVSRPFLGDSHAEVFP